MTTTSPVDQAPYFDDLLGDGELLLHFAAENGVEVEASTRSAILTARSLSSATPQITDDLLVAVTTLTAKLKPVTAESLKASAGDGERAEIKYLWRWTQVLAGVIVPFSIISFISSGISDVIRADIKSANELAVKLTTKLQTEPATSSAVAAFGCDARQQPTLTDKPNNDVELITNAQQFAVLIRDIDAKSTRLHKFVFWERSLVDPFETCRADETRMHAILQLPTNLPWQLASAVSERVYVYQDVRYFAQSLLDDTSLYYAALTAVILPVLYALLGALCYLLRTFDIQTREKTYVRSEAERARLIIAGVSGGVVGLFGNSGLLTIGGSTVPPLALAFLVGYAVDVFFSFLEGLLKSFGSKTAKS